MAQVIDDGGIGVLNEILAQLNQIHTDITAFTTAFNAHTHNPMTVAPVVGQQASVKATKVTKKL